MIGVDKRHTCIFFEREKQKSHKSEISIITHNLIKEHWHRFHYIGIDMEKSNGPVNASWSELKDGDKELVDAEFLVDLLESYRFGKDNVPTREFRFKAAATAPAQVNTTEIEVEVEEDNDGSQAQQGSLVNLSFSYMFFLSFNFWYLYIS